MSDIDRYNYAFDPDGNDWAARLLRRVPLQARSVLELGPGPGAMTRVLLARGHQVTVVENNPEAFQALKDLGAEVLSGDLDKPEWLSEIVGRRFDAVLACDVLEHLRKPEDLLESLVEYVAPMGCMVISVPNIAYAGVLAAMRNGVFDYSEKGQLDRTHVRFFTKRSIEKVLLDCGWAPRVWEANHVPIECSEFSWHWSALSGEQRQALLEGWHDFDVYQWMVAVTPSADAFQWELREVRENSSNLLADLQTLRVVHQREHASLLEHQKAFSEALEIIAKLQAEVETLHSKVGALNDEKTVVERELSVHQAEPPHTVSRWSERWLRLLGRV